MLREIREALEALAIPEKALFFPKFFKAGKGEYAEGDQFIGVTVPDQRKIAQHFSSKIDSKQLRELFKSPFHEERLTAIFILVKWYKKAPHDQKEKWVHFYLEQLSDNRVNNWDLVDSSAYQILGDFLLRFPEKLQILDSLSQSNHLWSERCSVVSTYAFIKKGQVEYTFKLAAFFMNHQHDLIHKACGWMLKEAGKFDTKRLLEFLNIHAIHMPRTMLRCAIEKLDEDLRQYYLKKKAV
jgi:3-methyladenine DNA glycosylase AlkD